jgi:alkylation response protein AidB-like acyl-CoA dehydrogenase
VISVDEFRARSRAWLATATGGLADEGAGEWGVGSDDVSVFHALDHAAERRVIDQASGWQREKFLAGYGAIAWPEAVGGAGLGPAHEHVFRSEEARVRTPPSHELVRISVNLVAPIIWSRGSAEQRDRFVRPLLGGELLACQLFSEPNAGSDLANLATAAVREGEHWRVNGSKVWVSGAAHAHWGELIARTDPAVPKHAGLTSFMVPMDAPGVEVRPIRQMSGGASFNEVFLSDVRIPDALRLGAEGAGWSVALETLGFERAQSGSRRGIGGSWEQLLALARTMGRGADPVVRQRLAATYTHERLRELTRRRADATRIAGRPPGPEGSVGKLLWVLGMAQISDVATLLLGPRLTADSGEWGTYAWAAHVLGAPGYRIAGGSDEIQRNILAERALGLPPEPRADRGRAWRDAREQHAGAPA